ncbi:hypothetical protein ACHAQJ_006939 [Trichoderma viride]
MAPDLITQQIWPDKGKVIILNGFPGTGKFTIAAELKSRFSADSARLVDNHVLIDPAQAIYSDRSAEHYDLRRKIREPVFHAIRSAAEEGKTILMTACLAENDADIRTFEEHISMVRNSLIPLYWINL